VAKWPPSHLIPLINTSSTLCDYKLETNDISGAPPADSQGQLKVTDLIDHSANSDAMCKLN